MKEITTAKQFDSVQTFLSSRQYPPVLACLTEKIRKYHPAYSRSKVFVDDANLISIVVIEDGDSIRSNPESNRLVIGLKENGNVNMACITQNFRLDGALVAGLCRSQYDAFTRSLASQFGHSPVASCVTYFQTQGSVSSINCPEGYSFRRATPGDVKYFHSTWKFARFSLTPSVESFFANILSNLPSVLVIKMEGEEEVIVGCGHQDIIGCIGKGEY